MLIDANPDLSLPQIGKLLRDQWLNLDQQAREPYSKLAANGTAPAEAGVSPFQAAVALQKLKKQNGEILHCVQNDNLKHITCHPYEPLARKDLAFLQYESTLAKASL